MAEISFSSVRLFPSAPSFASVPEQDTYAGLKVIELARGGTGLIKRYFAFRLSPIERILRLVKFLLEAVQAERDGYFERANFYWRRCHEELIETRADPRFWEALKSRIDSSHLPESESVRRSFVKELFVDTHTIFYRAYGTNTALDPGNRRFKHARWAIDLAELAGLPEGCENSMREELAHEQLAACETSGDTGTATEIALEAAKKTNAPVFRRRLFDLEWKFVSNKLQDGEATSTAENNVVVLTESLRRLESWRSEFPAQRSAYPILAHAALYLATALSRTERFSESIAMAQQALDYDPFLIEAQQVSLQLQATLKNLPARMKEVEAQIRSKGGELNDAGKRLKSEAQVGLGPMERYLKSPIAQSIRDGYLQAYGETIWKRIDFLIPISPDGSAMKNFLGAVGTSLLAGPAESVDADAAWREATSGDVRLSTVPWSSVACALSVEQPVNEEEPEATPIASSLLSQSLDSESVISLATSRPGREPVLDWLPTAQGRVARWAIASACALTLVAFGVTAFNAVVSSYRNQTYVALSQAAREGRNEDVVPLAAQFLRWKPLSGGTDQDVIVESLYAEALVRAFASNGATPSAKLVEAAKEFERLVGEKEQEVSK